MLAWYWWHSGQAVEGDRWLGMAVACRGDTPTAVSGLALAAAAWLALAAGRIDVVDDYASRAAALCEEAGDRSALALALYLRAMAAVGNGSVDVALTHLDRAQQVDDAVGEPWNSGLAASLRAIAAGLRGDTEAAEREAVSAIDTFRACGDVCTLVTMLDERRSGLERVGRIGEAEAAAREALAVSTAHGLRGWQSTMSTRLGSLVLARGDVDGAIALHHEALDVAREIALPTAESDALDNLEIAVAAREEARLPPGLL